MELLLGGIGLLKLRLPNSLLNLVLFSNVISKSDDQQLYARRLYLHKKWLSLSIIIFKSVITIPCDCLLPQVLSAVARMQVTWKLLHYSLFCCLLPKGRILSNFYKSHLIITLCVNNTVHTLMHFLKECYYSAFW